LIFLFRKGEKALPQIVEAHEQAHTHQHGDVFLQLHRGAGAGKHGPGQRLGHAVGDAVTHRDVQREPRHHRKTLFLVLKGEILVEKIAEDAAEEIVGGAGQPVTQPENIVEHEHDGRAEQRVNHAHQKELPEGLIQ